MVSWIVWLIVAAVLGVAELVTTTLAFGLIAVAALVAAAVGALDLPVPLQLVAFVVATGAGLGVIRPIAMRHIKQPPFCVPVPQLSSAATRSSWRRSPVTAGGCASAARNGPPALMTRRW
jgi:hypothetical protein